MNEDNILKSYEYAKEQFKSFGIDPQKAIERIDSIPISMQCWQGDDVIGFDGSEQLTGGIAATGKYPGRARTADELRSDMEKAISMIPGRTKVNLHACYAEKNGKNIDRDSYTIEQFQTWADWAKHTGIGLDFNPTFFSHPKMDGDFSLSSRNPDIRRFWIEHGKRCREIGLEFAAQLDQPCTVNYWMPDGFKDTPADTVCSRELMIRSLDEIFKKKIDPALAPEAIESKLFGVGVESYTVASHEFSLLYAISRNKLYTLDSGHFHPTEKISAKISAVLSFLDQILLHVSRGVRWDSDHVVTFGDDVIDIMNEIVHNGYEKRVHIGMDYFDASINRIACWVIGMRNARKALLYSALTPIDAAREAEKNGDFTARLAMQEEFKNLPMNAVWNYYLAKKNLPVGMEWLNEVKRYEREILIKR